MYYTKCGALDPLFKHNSLHLFLLFTMKGAFFGLCMKPNSSCHSVVFVLHLQHILLGCSFQNVINNNHYYCLGVFFCTIILEYYYVSFFNLCQR